MAYIATYQGKEHRVAIEETEAGNYKVRIGEELIEVDLIKARENIFSLLIENQSYEVDVDGIGRNLFSILIRGDHFDVEVEDEKVKKLAAKLGAGATGRQDIKSPMAGNVWKVMKKEGDRVEAGDVLIILEAMKMENEIKSPIAGIVTGMSAVEATGVGAGDPLCVIEPLEDTAR